jgi:hypothetical protein
MWTTTVGMKLTIASYGTTSACRFFDARGLDIVFSKAANTTMNRLYGIYIRDINQGDTYNYSILTNAGDVVFNDGGNALGDFTHKTDNYNSIFSDASNDSIVIMSNAAGKVGLWGVTAAVQPPAWTLSNSATLRTIDAHSLTLDNLADAFCTLVKDLSSWGAVGTA